MLPYISVVIAIRKMDTKTPFVHVLDTVFTVFNFNVATSTFMHNIDR
jgi:hypothetical protein